MASLLSLFFCILLATTAYAFHSQEFEDNKELAAPPPPLPCNNATQYVQLHNIARDAVGVPRLTWNRTLATLAAAYSAARCITIPPPPPYGYNVFRTSLSDTRLIPFAAVGTWIAQGGSSLNQVISRRALRFGCGCAACPDRTHVVTCFYDPRGITSDHLCLSTSE